MSIWKNVSDHAAEVCTNTMHLAILNYLIDVKKPQTLFQLMDVFTHKELTTDTIKMGELGLIDTDRLGFVPTQFALALKMDLNELEGLDKQRYYDPSKESNSATPEEDPYTGRSVLMSKDGEDGMLCIYSTGFWDGDKWIQMEGWTNSYHLNKDFIRSTSRFSVDFDEIVKEAKEEGWIIVEDESAKE